MYIVSQESQSNKVNNELHSLGNHSQEDTNSLKDDLNKSLDLARKKRKQLTLDNPEFQVKQEIEDEKQNIKVQNAIRRNISDVLKLSDLLKLKITSKDEKNPIHSLFRWFLLIFYKENPDLYNWGEFKKQILEKDHGKDLQSRLGYQNVIHITSLDAEKTKFLLNHKDQILEHNSKPDESHNVLVKIFDIIEIVLKTYEHAQKINSLVDELLKQEKKVKQCNEELEKLNQQIQEAKTSLKSLESKSLNDDDEIIQE